MAGMPWRLLEYFIIIIIIIHQHVLKKHVDAYCLYPVSWPALLRVRVVIGQLWGHSQSTLGEWSRASMRVLAVSCVLSPTINPIDPLDEALSFV